ncbi:MAG: hypothetical protein ABIR68_09240 [Ilumatobacteraceae bacterium]
MAASALDLEGELNEIDTGQAHRPAGLRNDGLHSFDGVDEVLLNRDSAREE